MSSKAIDWLTTDFVRKVLSYSENYSTIDIKSLTIKPAVADGENYGSKLIRVKVEYSRYQLSGYNVLNTISLIFKIGGIGDDATKELLTMFDVVDVEIKMMKFTLPQMTDILNEKNCRLCPKLLYYQSNDPSCIVMEDLTPLGYRMSDRRIGLDLEHSILAMRNLAKFHAASVALQEKGIKLQDMYKKGLYDVNYSEGWKQFVKGRIQGLANDLVNWPELGDEHRTFPEKLLKLSAVCYEKASECSNQNNNGFNVLNHGDFWINNMLFRYDVYERPTDHVFLDFQGPVWNSPAIDILNFFSTSLTENVELHHREELLKEYLNVLTNTMYKLQCKTKAPTMEDFEKIMVDYEFAGVMSTCLWLAMTLFDKNDATSNEIFDDDFIKMTYKGKAFRKRLIQRLSVWNAHGLLDF